MDSLLLHLSFDFIVIAVVIILMFSRLSFWHPLTGYLFFHIYSFSYRAYQIYDGAPLMYFGQADADMITVLEINRAMFWADIALLIFTAGSFLGHFRFELEAHRPVIRIEMSKRIVKIIGIPCLLIGMVFMFIFRVQAVGQVSADAGLSSAYFQVLAMWPIAIVGLMVFAYGFRWYLVVIGLFYLGVVAFQGYHRHMFILPLVFFAGYYLMTRRRRWPSFQLLVIAVIIGSIFPRLKYIGRAVQEGQISEALTYVSQSLDFSGKSSDAMSGMSEGFLDQYAGALTLIDDNSRKFMGSTYLTVITLPIPRSLWSGKPGLADHLTEISTSRRQYAREGRIISYLGEAYLNFGYAGLLVAPGLIGYLITLWCLRATTGPIPRFSRYFYLAALAAFLLMYRDGLASLVVFTVVHNMPMFFILIAHRFPGAAQKFVDRPPADPLSGEEEK
jgi:hypothetical protein